MPTTTVRVQLGTREAIRRLSAQRGQPADTVIREALEALEALEWRDLRQRAAREAAALRDDPRERQRARQVTRDLDDLRP